MEYRYAHVSVLVYIRMPYFIDDAKFWWSERIFFWKNEVAFEKPTFVQSIRGANNEHLKYYERVSHFNLQFKGIIIFQHTSHLKISFSSMRPAEKPSTGFLLSSASCFRRRRDACLFSPIWSIIIIQDESRVPKLRGFRLH